MEGGFGIDSGREYIKGGGVACAVRSSLPRGIGEDQFEALVPLKPGFKFLLLKRGGMTLVLRLRELRWRLTRQIQKNVLVLIGLAGFWCA